MDDIELLEKVSIRVIEYLKDEIGLNVSDKFSISTVENINSLYVSAVIYIDKDLCGTIGISIPKSIIAPITESLIFAKISEDEIDDYAEDTVAEVLNIALANVVKDLTVIKNGGEIRMTTPSIVENVTEVKRKNSKIYISKIKVDNEMIILSYF